MNYFYRNLSPSTLFYALVIVFVGVGLYIQFGNTGTPSSKAPAQTRNSVSENTVDWSSSSLVPTNVESYENGSYALTWNDQLTIRFIRTNGPESIDWPETETGQAVAQLQSHTIEAKLHQSLVDNITASSPSTLNITGHQIHDARDPDVLKKLSVTFNETLTIYEISIMAPRNDPWVAWPSMRYQGNWVDLVESNEDIERAILDLVNDDLDSSQPYESNTVKQFPPPEHGVRAEVINVFDGDTIKARLLDGTDKAVVVRIQGINCPESSRNDKCEQDEYREGMSCAEEIPYGKRAKRIAKRWLSGREIVLIPTNGDEFERGHYDRLIAYVRMRTGEDYGLKMVNQGYCKDTSRAFDHPRGSTYRQYESGLKPLR